VVRRWEFLHTTQRFRVLLMPFGLPWLLGTVEPQSHYSHLSATIGSIIDAHRAAGGFGKTTSPWRFATILR
jgi:hypothetical protein